MITIDVSVNIDKALRYLRDVEHNQVPYATAVAINNTAFAARGEVVREMKRVFIRPTRYTLNAVYVKKASKRNLVAVVGIKDFSAKATPPIVWLSPQIYGGTREYKRSEQLLRAAGILPAGWYAVPGARARINAAGNMSTGQIQQILSVLRASRDPGQNITARSRKRNLKPRDYFAIKPGVKSHLKPGVYERAGKRHVRPVLMFVRSVNYRPRLQFHRVIKDTFETRFTYEFAKAMKHAMRTSIPVVVGRAA